MENYFTDMTQLRNILLKISVQNKLEDYARAYKYLSNIINNPVCSINQADLQDIQKFIATKFTFPSKVIAYRFIFAGMVAIGVGIPELYTYFRYDSDTITLSDIAVLTAKSAAVGYVISKPIAFASQFFGNKIKQMISTDAIPSSPPRLISATF